MADGYVDMALTAAEQKEQNTAISPASDSSPRYPYGLCICLSEEELDKIGMDDDLKSGDVVEMDVKCKVTSKTETDRDGKKSCRVELQIIGIAAEEAEEAEAPPPPRRLGRSLPYRE